MILKEFTKCGLNLQLINDGSNVNPLSIQLAGSQKSKKGYRRFFVSHNMAKHILKNY